MENDDNQREGHIHLHLAQNMMNMRTEQMEKVIVEIPSFYLSGVAYPLNFSSITLQALSIHIKEKEGAIESFKLIRQTLRQQEKNYRFFYHNDIPFEVENFNSVIHQINQTTFHLKTNEINLRALENYYSKAVNSLAPITRKTLKHYSQQKEPELFKGITEDTLDKCLEELIPE